MRITQGRVKLYDDIVIDDFFNFVKPILSIQITIPGKKYSPLHQVVKIKFSAVVRPVLMTDVCVFVCENGVLSILI